VRTLNRKVWRELRENAVSVAVIVLIIAIGVAAFVGFGATQRILKASQHAYYRRYRFADFWVPVKKAPLSVLRRIERFPEIQELRARVVFDVVVDVPGEVEPLTGRLISTPVTGFDRTLNGICLTRGSGFSDHSDQEVILSESFARVHGLEPGRRIHVVLNRKWQTFRVVGWAISPEYVYAVRGPGDILPDPKHFAVLYVKEDYARQVLGFQDAFNELVGRLVPSRAGSVDEVLAKIERVLQPYGVLDKIPRRRQPSHRFLSDEIEGLGITATVMPAIFLGVAALVLNIVLLRLCQRQRTIIGTLKALGYTNREVTAHYLLFGLVVGAVGGLVGCVLGAATTHGMIVVYHSFFQFPEFLERPYPLLMLAGLLVSLTFALLGSLHGVSKVLRLQPAEAMRPRPPEWAAPALLQRLACVWHLLAFRTRWAIRNLLRNPLRTTTSIVATALSISIIFMALVMYDSFFFLLDFQFERVLHADVDLTLQDEMPASALYEVERLPGVDYAEPLFAMACDLRNGRFSRRLAVVGLPRRHRLTTPVQEDGRPVRIPRQGLVLSRKLAELLHVRPGQTLELTPVRGRQRTVRARVAAVVETYLGMDCYADRRYLCSLVGEYAALNSAQLLVDYSELPSFYKYVKKLPGVRGLSVRAEARRNIEQMLVETTVISIGLMVLFAGAIGFGSTVNWALIEISDRMREISTLRLLGYQPWEISAMLFHQTLVTFVFGTLLSFPLGLFSVHAIAQAYDSELYRMPVVVRLPVVGVTVVLAFVFVLLAQWVIHRQVQRLDWLEGVKVKE